MLSWQFVLYDTWLTQFYLFNLFLINYIEYMFVETHC